MKNFQSVLISIILFIPVLSFSQNHHDQKAIKKVIQTMADAWGEADGEKFASVFADNHDFIVWNGFYFKDINPQQNAQNHNYIFESIYKGTDMYFEIDQMRFVREDVAIVHVYGAVTIKGKPKPEDPTVLFTAVLEKTESDWLISSFHNLDLEVFENEELKAQMPIPHHKMYAGWYQSDK